MPDLGNGTLSALLNKIPPNTENNDTATFGIDQVDSELTVSVDDLEGHLLEIVPHKDNAGIDDGVNLLQSLHDVRIEDGNNVSPPHSFEIWYDRGEFHFFLEAATERARDRFQRRVSNVYTDAEVNPVDQGVGFPTLEPGFYRAAGYLEEKRHTFLPIKHHNAEGFDTGDPYADILGEMTTLDNSVVVLQVIFKPAHPEWTHKGPDGAKVEHIAEDLRTGDVEDLTQLKAWNPLRELEEHGPSKKDKQAAQIVEEQRGRQGFHANIRVFAASPDQYEAEERVRGTTSMFAKYYNSQTEQGLRAHGVTAEDVPTQYGWMITREWKDRSMILSIDELAGVAHIPNGEIEVPGIQWRHSKTGSEVPSTAPKDETVGSPDKSYSAQSSGSSAASSHATDDMPSSDDPAAGSLLSEAEDDPPDTDDSTQSTEPPAESETDPTSDAWSTDSEEQSNGSDGLWSDTPSADGEVAKPGQTPDTPQQDRTLSDEQVRIAADAFLQEYDGGPGEISDSSLRMVAHEYTDVDIGTPLTPEAAADEEAVKETVRSRREAVNRSDDDTETQIEADEPPVEPPADHQPQASKSSEELPVSESNTGADSDTEAAIRPTNQTPLVYEEAADGSLSDESLAVTLNCPSCDARREYTRLVLNGYSGWECGQCQRVIDELPEGVEPPSKQVSQESTADDPPANPPEEFGMDRIALTPKEELLSEYVRLLIASIPAAERDRVSQKTTVRELITIIRELEQQDKLVPFGAGVIENTRPDRLEATGIVEDGEIQLPDTEAVDDRLSGKPIQYLDVDPNEVDTFETVTTDGETVRTPESTDSTANPTVEPAPSDSRIDTVPDGPAVDEDRPHDTEPVDYPVDTVEAGKSPWWGEDDTNGGNS